MDNDANTDYRCVCPNDGTGLNCEEATKSGLTYKVFTEAKTWIEAREECEAINLTLASIYDSDAHEFLLTYTMYVLKVSSVMFFIIIIHIFMTYFL